MGFLFPQQRKLTGSSAQISSGVRRCGSQAQVPEGSGGFHKVPVCAGVAASGVCGGSGRFRRVKGQAQVLEGFASSNAPMCRFEIEKANAHDAAMYALLLLGIPPKLIFFRLHHFPYRWSVLSGEAEYRAEVGRFRIARQKAGLLQGIPMAVPTFGEDTWLTITYNTSTPDIWHINDCYLDHLGSVNSTTYLWYPWPAELSESLILGSDPALREITRRRRSYRGAAKLPKLKTWLLPLHGRWTHLTKKCKHKRRQELSALTMTWLKSRADAMSLENNNHRESRAPLIKCKTTWGTHFLSLSHASPSRLKICFDHLGLCHNFPASYGRRCSSLTLNNWKTMRVPEKSFSLATGHKNDCFVLLRAIDMWHFWLVAPVIFLIHSSVLKMRTSEVHWFAAILVPLLKCRSLLTLSVKFHFWGSTFIDLSLVSPLSMVACPGQFSKHEVNCFAH